MQLCVFRKAMQAYFVQAAKDSVRSHDINAILALCNNIFKLNEITKSDRSICKFRREMADTRADVKYFQQKIPKKQLKNKMQKRLMKAIFEMSIVV